MLVPAIILLVLALIVLLLSSQTQKSAGLPGGSVIYADTGKWEKVEKPLYDPVTQITGRPDYLVKQGSQIIPVEVKSGSAPDSPYDSHIFQLAAYCLLVEREFGKRPAYGIIHYGKRTFSVPYTPELESSLIDLLTEMRQNDRRGSVARSHEQAARCRGCGYAYTCEQAL
ncbi:MAG TPA: CRISPR-associated protein Cas4 [Anaerolineales bacterium]|nr:CRISPR-associated protein Cas4 [Anaerolineales bacterium]